MSIYSRLPRTPNHDGLSTANNYQALTQNINTVKIKKIFFI